MFNQNTPEWLDMRKSMVGASDAPIIMEVSPWKTPYQLWEEKLGLSESNLRSSRMQRGHDLEPLARLEVEKQLGLFLLPEVRIHASFSWMMASLDAIDSEGKYIVEIKCPGTVDHNLALTGNIPDKYFPQLQHQLEVCQLEMAYYFSFDGTKGVLIKVYRDDNYIKNMLKKEQQFWECMQGFTAPAFTDRDYQCTENPQWAEAANEWITINDQLKQLESREEKVRKQLILMAENKNTVGAGLKACKFLRKGNVDYFSIPEIQGVDVDKYRKMPTECWKFTAV